MIFTNSFFPLFGTLLIILAIIYRFAALLITNIKNSKCTLKALGTIVKFEEIKILPRFSKYFIKDQLYIPIYEYEVNGNTYTVKGNPQCSSLENIGYSEYIFYDPDKPSRILQKNYNSFKILLGFIILLLIGITFILYGLL